MALSETDHSADSETRQNVGIAHEKLGLPFQLEGRLQDANEELSVALSHNLALSDADPENVNAQITLAVREMQMGALMASSALPSFRNAAAARVHYESALQFLRVVLAIDSSNVRLQRSIDEVNTALQGL